MPSANRKDVAKSIKTLLVVLQSMRDQNVAITLRNDSVIRGTVVKVDSNMNVELRNAIIELDPFYRTVPDSTDSQHDQQLGELKPYFMVKGSRIRHIDVPNNFEPIKQAKQEIERLRARTRAWTKKDIVR